MEFAEAISYMGAVALISLSGAMAPGPVTAVTIARGAQSPHAGAWVAVGHAVVELPLIALVYFGVGEAFKLPLVKVLIGAAGGLILLWMGIGMLRDFDRAEQAAAPAGHTRSPFMAGLLLSIANPYFLIWWATAGAVLVGKSLPWGVAGFFMLVPAHWLIDFGWLYFLSAFAFSGGKFFGQKLQQGAFILCGLALLYFGGYFLASAGLGWRS